ncbi:MAG: hypothetical protein JEZ06_21870 [Anaerolineaceae bacterium]|nr:hypothetical protein [Anaerolineaceae bacterium]
MKKETGKFNPREGGQVLVILVIAAAALLAFTGLAIDGSLLMAEKRQSQNVADISAIAAARAICLGEDVNAAIQTIALNNYGSIDFMDQIAIHQPPISGPYTGNSEYVEVVIDTQIEAGLISSVYQNPLETTSRAVAHCIPPAPSGAVGNGNALIALNPTAKDAIKNNGNPQVFVNNGGIFVNSNHSQAFYIGGSNAAIVSADTINIVGGYKKQNNPTLIPNPPNTGAAPITDPLIDIDPPAGQTGSCATVQVSGGTPAIDPGRYCSIKVSGQAGLTLNPGTYYLGGDIHMAGQGTLTANNVNIIMQSGSFMVTGQGDFNATEFFIYLKNGDLDLTGQGAFTVTPPSSGSYAGMAVYMDRSNAADVDIVGNGASLVSGTFYVPAADVDILGNGQSMTAQFIGDTFTISGNGALTVNYDPNSLFQIPSSPKVEMVE